MPLNYFYPYNFKKEQAIANGELSLYYRLNDEPNEFFQDYMRDVLREIKTGNTSIYRHSKKIYDYNKSGFLDYSGIEQVDDDTWAIFTFPTKNFHNALDALEKGLVWNCKTQQVDYEKTNDYYPTGITTRISNETFEMSMRLPMDDENIKPIILRLMEWKLGASPSKDGRWWEK